MSPGWFFQWKCLANLLLLRLTRPSSSAYCEPAEINFDFRTSALPFGRTCAPGFLSIVRPGPNVVPALLPVVSAFTNESINLRGAVSRWGTRNFNSTPANRHTLEEIEGASREGPETASWSKRTISFSYVFPPVQHGHGSWRTNGPKRRGFSRGSASLQHDC